MRMKFFTIPALDGEEAAAELDRWLSARTEVRAMLRYMDDLLWCCDDKAAARRSLRAAEEWIADTLKLEVKQPARIGRCRQGTLFRGYRVLPGCLLLSRRRKRRYIERRRYWESLFEQGLIGPLELQAGYAATLGITAHADAAVWRREQLRRRPLAQRLQEV